MPSNNKNLNEGLISGGKGKSYQDEMSKNSSEKSEDETLDISYQYLNDEKVKQPTPPKVRAKPSENTFFKESKEESIRKKLLDTNKNANEDQEEDEHKDVRGTYEPPSVK